MDLKEIKENANQIQYNHDCLLSSFVKQEGFTFSNIFHNVGDKALGQAMYDVIKDMIKISKTSWQMDEDDFIAWIKEIFFDLEKDEQNQEEASELYLD